MWEADAAGGGWAIAAKLPEPQQKVTKLLRLSAERFVSVDGSTLRTWARGGAGVWAQVSEVQLPHSGPDMLCAGVDGGLAVDGGSGQLLLLAPEGDGWSVARGPKQTHRLEAAHVLSADCIMLESTFNHPEVHRRQGDGSWSGRSLESGPGFRRCSRLLSDGTLVTLNSKGVMAQWASGGQDGYALQPPALHDGQATCCAALEGGGALSGAEDGTVAVLTPVPGGAMVQGAPLPAHGGAVVQLLPLTPTCFASLGVDGTVAVRQLQGGQWVAGAAPAVSGPVRGMAVGGQGDTLYLLDASGEVTLWQQGAGGAWGQTSTRARGPVSSSVVRMAVSGDSVCMGDSHGTVHFYTAGTADAPAVAAAVSCVHRGAITAAVALPDGRFVTSSNECNVCVWRRDAEGAWVSAVALPAASHEPTSVTVLPCGAVVTACYRHAFVWHELAPNTWMGRDGAACLEACDAALAVGDGCSALCIAEGCVTQWGAGTSSGGNWRVSTLQGGSSDTASHLAAFEGGVAVTVVKGGGGMAWRPGEGGVWAPSPGLPPAFVGEPTCMVPLQGSEDSMHRVLLGRKDGLAAVWRLQGQQWTLQAALGGHTAAVTTALSLSGGALLTADENGLVQLWMPSGDGGAYKVLHSVQETAVSFSCAAAGKEGEVFLGMKSGVVRVFRLDTSAEEPLTVVSSIMLHGSEVCYLGTALGGSTLLSVDSSGHVGVSTLTEGVWVPQGTAAAPSDRIIGLALHDELPAVVFNDGKAVVLSA